MDPAGAARQGRMVYSEQLSVAESVAEIPNRALFKASEVCEIAQVQRYVLRSWEAEFSDLGVVRTEGSARAYRRRDVERVLHIKQLVFVEGLTLAGVRRRLLDESGVVAEDAPFDELFGRHARERLTAVKQGLRSLLDLLSNGTRPSNGTSAMARPRQQALPDLSAGVVASSARRTRALSPPQPNGRVKRRAHA